MQRVHVVLQDVQLAQPLVARGFSHLVVEEVHKVLYGGHVIENNLIWHAFLEIGVHFHAVECGRRPAAPDGQVVLEFQEGKVHVLPHRDPHRYWRPVKSLTPLHQDTAAPHVREANTEHGGRGVQPVVQPALQSHVAPPKLLDFLVGCIFEIRRANGADEQDGTVGCNSVAELLELFLVSYGLEQVEALHHVVVCLDGGEQVVPVVPSQELEQVVALCALLAFYVVYLASPRAYPNVAEGVPLLDEVHEVPAVDGGEQPGEQFDMQPGGRATAAGPLYVGDGSCQKLNVREQQPARAVVLTQSPSSVELRVAGSVGLHLLRQYVAQLLVRAGAGPREYVVAVIRLAQIFDLGGGIVVSAPTAAAFVLSARHACMASAPNTSLNTVAQASGSGQKRQGHPGQYPHSGTGEFWGEGEEQNVFGGRGGARKRKPGCGEKSTRRQRAAAGEDILVGDEVGCGVYTHGERADHRVQGVQRAEQGCERRRGGLDGQQQHRAVGVQRRRDEDDEDVRAERGVLAARE
eukprot:3933237-Rhodomonas_salina.2